MIDMVLFFNIDAFGNHSGYGYFYGADLTTGAGANPDVATLLNIATEGQAVSSSTIDRDRREIKNEDEDALQKLLDQSDRHLVLSFDGVGDEFVTFRERY